MKAGLYWKANLPSWDALTDIATNTPTGKFMSEQLELRSRGLGLPHTDASIRLFDGKIGMRLDYCRDTNQSSCED